MDSICYVLNVMQFLIPHTERERVIGKKSNKIRAPDYTGLNTIYEIKPFCLQIIACCVYNLFSIEKKAEKKPLHTYTATGMAGVMKLS